MADKVKCTVVSGAPNDCAEFLKERVDKNSFIIAADSGYRVLEKADIKPDLIIADFDSSKRPETECEIITFPIEKSRSDTFNCVVYAVENGFKKIEIFNAIGSRLDHTYANLLCLDYCRKHGAECVIIDAHNRVSLITGEHTFKKDYDFFSLFAFLEDCEGVSIKGAFYTAGWYGKEELSLSQGEQYGLGNYITDEYCTVSVKKGTLLLIEAND